MTDTVAAKPAADPQLNPKLVDAIEDARILLAFASETGKALPDGIVKTIVESAQCVSQRSISTDQEAAFWAALNKLAQAISPVTVGTLRSTMDSHASPTTILGVTVSHRSLARSAVRWYTAVAIIALSALILAQVYWLFGTMVTSDIIKINKQVSELEAQIKPLQVAAGKTTDAESARRQLLNAQIETLEGKKASNYILLELWSAAWNDKLAEEVKDKGNLSVNNARLQTATLVLEILQRYALPLLYGLLGTCVYVLRMLSAQIFARTYSEASNIGFRIRLYLGTLGGMVIAYFVTPESADGLFSSLSPFALAFLAGYSVELLFAVMDRFLTAFTNKDARAPEQPTG